MNIKLDYCKCIRMFETAHLRSDFRKNTSLPGARTHKSITLVKRKNSKCTFLIINKFQFLNSGRLGCASSNPQLVSILAIINWAKYLEYLGYTTLSLPCLGTYLGVVAKMKSSISGKTKKNTRNYAKSHLMTTRPNRYSCNIRKKIVGLFFRFRYFSLCPFFFY